MGIARHDPSSILSSAVEHGNTVYLAGVVAKDLGKDVKGQTKEVLDEIDRLLGKCGSHKSKVLQAQIWVTDIRNRASMNEVWTAWADATNLPTRACVEARAARERPHGLNVPLVAIVPPGEKRKALAAGVDAVYARPAKWKPYSRLVERVLAEWAPTRRGSALRRARTS